MYTIYLNGEHYGYVTTQEAVARVKAKYGWMECQSWYVAPELI